ncbi:MAG: glycosyltransferase family 39 protein [Deltaproteobacteria bacterium]|nr:glycosyltransferase family 39 protein [Deltaproteobacteria bacterium]
MIASAVWLVSAGHFAAHQELWVDETTQLSGLGLPFTELLDWLTGGDAGRFDVPPDRMPPLSYLIGKLWVLVFGLSEGSLRWLGITAGLGAIWLTIATARRVWGGAAAWLAGLALAASPQLAVLGVEIRAYPLLLLAAAATFCFFERWVSSDARERRTTLAATIACVVCACYLHYFGLVLAGGVFCALAWVCLVERRGLGHVLWFAGAVGLASLGLLPFLRAAVGISGSDEAAGRGSLAVGLARFGYRLLGGHPVVGVSALLVIAVVGGTASLVALGLRRGHASKFPTALLIALVSGLTAAVAASLAVRGFDALRIAYNSWALPALALLAGAALGASQGWRRRGAVVAAVVLLVGDAAASVLLWRRPEPFAHSAGDRVTAEVERAGGVGRVVVVHDGESGWGIAYFPLSYRYGRALRQMLATPRASGEVSTALLPSLSPLGDGEQLAAARQQGATLLLLASRQLDAAATKALLTGGDVDQPRSPALTSALERAGWRATRSEWLPAMGAVQLTVFERAAP